MSEAKHTPGPWTVLEHDDGVFILANGAMQIADVTYVIEHANETGSRRLQNARVIAAAPDMLAALRIAEQFMSIASDWNIDEAEIDGEMRSTYDWLEVVRAAIAKAQGE